MRKAIKSKLKGKDVLICKVCGTVVQNLNPTERFPEGYTYNECLVCKNEVDLNAEDIKVEKVTSSDIDIVKRWAEEIAAKKKEQAQQ